MHLKDKISKIFSNKKFDNLNNEIKLLIEQSVFAHCLILSPENQERYLKTFEQSVNIIEDLGDTMFQSNGNCYDGIVRTKMEKDPDEVLRDIKKIKQLKNKNIFFSHLFSVKKEDVRIPLKYEVYVKEYDLPLNRITRCILHELGHVVIKNNQIDSSNTFLDKDGVLKISFGGLIINNEFKNSFGSIMQEVINEFTTFIAYKAFLAYPDFEADEKMREAIENTTIMNLSFEDKKSYLDILPDNLFASYTESEFATDSESDMFNFTYVRYTPLVKLIMNSFQNPRFSYLDLKNEFINGNGLAATKDNEPINDLLYGYYVSSFRPLVVFDEIMSDTIDWETLCKEFDGEIYNQNINKELIDRYISYFQEFYEKRNIKFLSEGKISKQQYNQNMDVFLKNVEACHNYYNRDMIK